MFELYSEKARRVIFFARKEASEMGDREINPVHLLLGLLGEGKAMFLRFKVTPRKLKAIHRACAKEASNQEQLPTSVDMPLHSLCGEILERASLEMQTRKHAQLDLEHLLLAMLYVPSKAAEILQKQGINYAKVAVTMETRGHEAPGMADYT
jgi:ATP-dependent Clp protease ATP-binding subunit ClpC